MFAVSFFLKRNELGKGGNVDSLDLGRSACHMPMNFARKAGGAVVLVAVKLSLGVGGAVEIDSITVHSDQVEPHRKRVVRSISEEWPALSEQENQKGRPLENFLVR